MSSNTEIRNAGATLANIAYNLAQDASLPDHIRKILGDARKEWDASVEAAQQQLAQRGASGDPVLYVRQKDLDDTRLRTPIVSKEGPTEDGWSVPLYTAPPAAVQPTIEQERADFEDWYSARADLKVSPIGSRDCALQWSAWLARGAGTYHARIDWKISPMPWGPASAMPDSGRDAALTDEQICTVANEHFNGRNANGLRLFSDRNLTAYTHAIIAMHSQQLAAAPVAQQGDGELPPLPEPAINEKWRASRRAHSPVYHFFTADQMRGYAIDYGIQLGRAALAQRAGSDLQAPTVREFQDMDRGKLYDICCRQSHAIKEGEKCIKRYQDELAKATAANLVSATAQPEPDSGRDAALLSREVFEAAYRAKKQAMWPHHPLDEYEMASFLKRDADGNYITAHGEWIGWELARAALAAQPSEQAAVSQSNSNADLVKKVSSIVCRDDTFEVLLRYRNEADAHEAFSLLCKANDAERIREGKAGLAALDGKLPEQIAGGQGLADADTKRLDFIIANDAFIVKVADKGNFLGFQLMTQNEDEEYIELSGECEVFTTERAAIDMAMDIAAASVKGEPK